MSDRNNGVRQSRYSLLLVDDEAHILSTLKRLFAEWDDVEVFTAESATAGAAILKKEPVDVLISDERMPKIEGHKFVQFVKEHHPETLRIILTGYSDSHAMREAVNRGEVYRYLFKPWDADELLVTVRNALEYSRANRERAELTAKLALANEELEAKVQQRTAELHKVVTFIKAKQAETDRTLQNAIQFLTGVVDVLDKQTDQGSFTRRLARVAGILAEHVDVPEEDTRLAVTTCYMLNIAAVSAGSRPDGYLTERGDVATAVRELSEHLAGTVLLYPALEEAIRHVSADFDGGGTPDALEGEAIPVAARLVRVALDFLVGTEKRKLPAREVVAGLRRLAGRAYDPRIVAAAASVLADEESQEVRTVALTAVTTGNILAEDLRLDTGIIFLSAGTELTGKHVTGIHARIRDAAFPLSGTRSVLIYREGKAAGR